MTRTNASLDVTQASATSGVISWEGKREDESISWLHVLGVDTDFVKTFEVEMAQGHFFSEEFPAELKDGFVVNEAAVRAMNMDSPVGKKFHFWDFDGTIIGVIKDFHFNSLHKKIEPLVLKYGLSFNFVLIRIQSGNMAATIDHINQETKKIIPNFTFEFEFLDDKLNNLYQAEMRMKNITKYISFLAVFISCLGLLGLAAFTAEQRTKEMGIRKVLGASTSGLVFLLTKEFFKWVLVANIISWPVAYFAAKKWLQNFAYRAPMGIEIFLLSGILVLLITFLTVSIQAIRAAQANPVNSLRYE
jgi:putative ABC transport system permease protein